ncbi:U3 small nucleolar RNA-associated protein 14 homolog A [Brienomyrus brachyistius]|uniref:U3 small nucleolar RNA-associated protein 14 homolog A n=1 Tax=Brienomyrus brachyistius TaxID=42636 RepID=UPI0020B4518D|nr:U3 small nucleolar RNA-associated protein 14 homolog A [Brienomyrus brachyistius]
MAKSKVKHAVKAPIPSSTSVKKNQLSYDDDEDELFEDDTVISASEDEGGSDDERKHRKLLEAIGSLDGKKRRKLAERSEASLQVSEFTVSAEGAGEKIRLCDLLGRMDQVPSAVSKTKKQLKNLQNQKDTVELPLSRQQTEKIQREAAYEKATKTVSQWQPVVEQNKRAEQLVFPLNQEPSGPKRVEQVVVGWKAQTPLEQEIFRLLHKNMQPVHDPVLTPLEEASLKAMSLEEAKIRRAELQKARALQSYYEAKARRERKIKSKKYHKVLKKAKRKEFLREFEEMRESNPAAALEELKKMELARMQERMSLKHQNSGKWAKSKAIMAKYDTEARKAMQQQLEMNKELTQKLVVPSEEEEVEQEEAEVLPDFVNEAQSVTDPANPWMTGRLTQESSEPGDNEDEPMTGDKSQLGGVPEEEEEEEEHLDDEEVLLRQFDEKRKLRQLEKEGLVPSLLLPDTDTLEEKEEPVVDSSEDENEEDVSEFNSLFLKVVKDRCRAPVGETKKPESKGTEKEEPALLEEGPTRVVTLEDMDRLLSQEGSGEDSEMANQVVSPPPAVRSSGTTSQQGEKSKKNKRKKVIDCNKVLTKETRALEVPLLPTVIDDEENEVDQKLIIKEAFAGDDVVSDFLKEKRQQEEAGKPKVVDLTLPGWGEWGGVGLKPSRRKRRRFRVKVAPPPPRQDEKLPTVIISEKRDSSVAAHQVSQLPFPFENPKQFERSICTPIGNTWNTPRTVQKFTAPKVISRMGAVIEPISREDSLGGKTQSTTGKAPDIQLPTGGAKGKGSHKERKRGRLDPSQPSKAKKSKAQAE